MASEQATYRAVGRRLAEARVKAGFSQAQLGSMIGVSGPRISHFESGHAFPPQSHRQALADAVKVDVSELFGDVEESPRQRLPRRRMQRSETQPRRTPQRRSTAAEQAIIANQILRLLDRMDISRQRLSLSIIRTIARQS
jgi:transcriptional regulator with XRE-family HTH domain